MRLPIFFQTGLLLVLLFIQRPVSAGQKQLVFDLTGSFHGYGDVIGPFWTLLDLKKLDKKNKLANDFTVILDGRSQEILEEIYHCSSLNELEKKLDIKFVSPSQVVHQPKADYLFQLFYGGRRIESFDEHPAIGPKTSVIISDTMHGTKLDEVRIGDRHYYYNPPGIGNERSGIVNSPEIALFSRNAKAQRKAVLRNKIKKLPNIAMAQALFDKDGPYKAVKFSFLYGIHNEILDYSKHPELQGQTKDYLRSIEKLSRSETPIIVFTPNTAEQIKQAMGGTAVNILSLADIKARKPLENRVYVVPTGRIPSEVFTGLMSVSDFPVLLEGNNAVSTALRLNVPFVMYRSLWNKPQIHDLMTLEQTKLGTCNYAQAYNSVNLGSSGMEDLLNKLTSKIDPDDAPGLELPQHSSQKADKTQGEIISEKLSENTKDLAKKIFDVIEVIEKITPVRPGGDGSSAGREHRVGVMTQAAIQELHDGALAYSVLRDCFEKGEISSPFFLEQKKKLVENGYKVEELESRFNPNIPNFSAKFDELDGIAAETEGAQTRALLAELSRAPKRDISLDPEVNDYLKEHKVYVSMTTSPQRMTKIHHILNSLDLDRVEEVLISIPKKFGRDGSEYSIPKEVLHHPKVKILRVAEDYGPITKMIPAIGYARQKDMNSLVISVDDDIGYPRGTIDELIYQSVKNKNSVVSGSGYTFPGSAYHAIEHFPQLVPKSSNNESHNSENGVRSVDMVEGWGSIAYRAGQVDLNLLKALSNLSKQCLASDDLVISFALAVDQVPRMGISNQFLSSDMLKPLPYGLQEDALHRGAGLEGSDVDMNHKKYKECFDLLKRVAYDPELNTLKNKSEILHAISELPGGGLNPKISWKDEPLVSEAGVLQSESKESKREPSQIQKEFAGLKRLIDQNPARADQLILAAVSLEGKDLKVHSHAPHMRVDTLRTYMNDRMASIPRGTYLFALTDVVKPHDLGSELPPVLAYAADRALVESGRVLLIPDIEAQLGYESRLEKVRPQNSKNTEEWQRAWTGKKREFFWRGSTTGSIEGDENSSNRENTRRGQLVMYARSHPAFVDAAFTSYVHFDDPKEQRAFSEKYPLATFASPKESLAYRYLVDVDGNGPSYERVAWILSSDSLLVKEKSDYVQWYYDKLVPWKNYVSFDSPTDLNALHAELESPGVQSRIPDLLKEAQKTAKDTFSKAAVTRSFIDGVSAYSKRTR